MSFQIDRIERHPLAPEFRGEYGTGVGEYGTETDVQVVLLLLGWLRGIWDWGSNPLLTNFFFVWVFQWFFISSVRLGKSPAIRDHLHSFNIKVQFKIKLAI